MTTPFPALRPSTRSVQVGRYPVKSFTALNGTSITRLYGSKRSNSTLQLTFSGVKDADVQKILTAYDSSYGGFNDLTLPREIWTGFNNALANELQSDYKWRFNEAPTIETLFPGVFAVNVSLIGTLSPP